MADSDSKAGGWYTVRFERGLWSCAVTIEEAAADRRSQVITEVITALMPQASDGVILTIPAKSKT